MSMATILVMYKTICINLCHLFLRMCYIKFGFDWQGRFRKFDNNGHIHEYSPGAGADNPLGSNVFQKHFQLND